MDIEGNLFEIQEKHKNLGEDLNILVAQEREEGGGVTFEGYIKKVYDVQKFTAKNSWSYCNHCYSLVRIPMMNNFVSKTYGNTLECPCLSDRYAIPKSNDFLPGLTRKIQNALGLFYIDTNSLIANRHGYRQRKGPIKVVVATKSLLILNSLTNLSLSK